MKILEIKHLNDYDACIFLNYYKNDLNLIIKKYINYEIGDYEEEIEGQEIEFEIHEINMSDEALEFCREFIDTNHVDLIKLED